MENPANIEIMRFLVFFETCNEKLRRHNVTKVYWLNELLHLLKRPCEFHKFSKILTIFEPNLYQIKTHYNV